MHTVEFADTLTLNEIIDAIEATYESFIKNHGFADTPTVSAGFYAAIEEGVKKDPHPNAAIQEELLVYLHGAHKDGVDDILEEVMLTFHDVQNRLTV